MQVHAGNKKLLKMTKQIGKRTEEHFRRRAVRACVTGHERIRARPEHRGGRTRRVEITQCPSHQISRKKSQISQRPRLKRRSLAFSGTGERQAGMEGGSERGDNAGDRNGTARGSRLVLPSGPGAHCSPAPRTTFTLTPHQTWSVCPPRALLRTERSSH